MLRLGGRKLGACESALPMVLYFPGPGLVTVPIRPGGGKPRPRYQTLFDLGLLEMPGNRAAHWQIVSYSGHCTLRADSRLAGVCVPWMPYQGQVHASKKPPADATRRRRGRYPGGLGIIRATRKLRSPLGITPSADGGRCPDIYGAAHFFLGSVFIDSPRPASNP